MRITEATEGTILVVRLEGDVDMQYSPMLRQFLQAQVAKRCPKLLLDLSAVQHMDSAALSALIEYQRDIAHEGGAFAIVGASERLRTVFEIVKLQTRVALYERVDEALKDLEECAPWFKPAA